MAGGPARIEAAKPLRARLEALAKAHAIATSPLGGQHGEVLELLHSLLKIDAPKQADRLIANVRETSPTLADHLGRWWMNQIHANCFTPTR